MSRSFDGSTDKKGVYCFLTCRMNNQTSYSRYVLVVLCIAVAFTAFILVILNTWSNHKTFTFGIPAVDQVMQGQTYEDGYKAGYQAARQKLSTRPPLPPGTPVTTANGTITSVNAVSLTMVVDSLDTDELVDGVSDTRTVNIATSTAIILRTNLSIQDMEKQMTTWREDGMKKNQPPPAPYKESHLNIADLKPGQTITVVTSNDLRLQSSFTATKILIAK